MNPKKSHFLLEDKSATTNGREFHPPLRNQLLKTLLSGPSQLKKKSSQGKAKIASFQQDQHIIRAQSVEVVLENLKEEARSRIVNKEAVKFNPDWIHLPTYLGEPSADSKGLPKSKVKYKRISQSNIQNIWNTRGLIFQSKNFIEVTTNYPRNVCHHPTLTLTPPRMQA